MQKTITKPPESDELTEQQRGTVQLRQSESLTMNGHIRNKLKLCRQRLKKTWQDADQLAEDEPGEEVDDDMQILARDIDLSTKIIKPAETPAPAPVATPPAQSKPRWPLAAALALGLGVPGTTGILMAPTIIEALQGDPPVVNVPTTPEHPEYAPILLPGKPQGVQ